MFRTDSNFVENSFFQGVLHSLTNSFNRPITMYLFSKKENILLLCLWMTSCCFSQDLSAECEWTVYTFPNGNKASEGCLINGQPEGIWTAYHANGQVKSKGNRQDFQLEGTWEFFDSTGVKLRSVEYAAGAKSGWERMYRLDRTLKAEQHFQSNKREGWTYEYDGSGQRRKAIPFRSDLEDGKGKEYAADGRTIALLEYDKGYLRNVEKINRYDLQGEKTGMWMEWNDNGILMEQGPWQTGKRNGLFRFYDQWGQLEDVIKYLDGEVVVDAEEAQEIDIRTTEHENGVIASRATYENGVRVGVYTEYAEDGSIVSGALYEKGVKIGEGITNAEGKRIGQWKQYYPDGALKSEGEFIDGKREGNWRFYAETGQLVQEGTYRDGAFNGNWRWYYLDGSLHRDESYRRGKADGEFQELDKAGKTLVKGRYDFGLKQGPWIVDVNDNREEGEYVDGERNGDWKHTYPDGTAQFEGSYELGIPVGKHIYKDTNGSTVRVERYELGQRDGKWLFYGPNQMLQQTLEYKRGELVRIDGKRIKPIEG